MKRSIIASIAVLLAVALAGCGYTTKKPTQFAQLQKATTFYDLEDAVEALVAKQPVDGAVYVRANHPDVVGVTEVAERWLKILRDMDYRTYDKTSILLDLTKKFRDVAVSQGFVDGTARDFENGKVVTKQDGFEVTAVVLGPDYNSAVVVGSEYFTVVDATPTWLNANKFVKNTSYVATAKFRLLKENDVWKLDAVNIATATEVK